MRVAILGGSFDPPHFGHLLVARQTLEFGPEIDQVWLMPCFSHPWRKPVAGISHRIKMARFLESQGIKVSDFEAKQKGVNYTIKTVRLLKRKLPYRFFWLIGSDLLKDFSKWREAEKLIQETRFLVFPRGEMLKTLLPQGFQLISSEILVVSNLSSSIIRERIKRDLPIKGMVPEGVEKYIKRYKLYSYGSRVQPC